MVAGRGSARHHHSRHPQGPERSHHLWRRARLVGERPAVAWRRCRSSSWSGRFACASDSIWNGPPAPSSMPCRTQLSRDEIATHDNWPQLARDARGCCELRPDRPEITTRRWYVPSGDRTCGSFPEGLRRHGFWSQNSLAITRSIDNFPPPKAAMIAAPANQKVELNSALL